MKFLKRTVAVLGVMLLIYTIIAFFCSSHFHFERSVMINASNQQVFDNVNKLKTWSDWSYWYNVDSAMKQTFEGPESGIGSKNSWESTNENVGKGSQFIKAVEPGKRIDIELSFEGMGTSMANWYFKDTANMVMVTSTMDSDISFFQRPIMAMMNMDEMLGPDFEKNLKGLKDYCEAAPKKPELRIELANSPAMKVMLVNDSADMTTISAKLGELYGTIGAEMKKQGLTMAGPVFAIYNKVSEKDGAMKFWFDAGAQTDKAGKSAGRVQYKEMPAMNVVKAFHYGDYNTAASHEAIDVWIKANNKQIIGSPWEVYLTDPMMEKDTAKWLTEIWYPVQ
jgi:effector-binding domain-containing protein